MVSSVATHGSGQADTARLNDIVYLDTFWDDITGSLAGRQLSSVAGKVSYDWAEAAITMEPGGDITVANDRIIFSIQIPHAAKADSTIYLHIHWEQAAASAYEFTVEYRVQGNGKAKTTTWTPVVVPVATNSAFTYVSGTLNQITSLAAIDLTGAGISATVQFRLVRSDAVTGDIRATFIDCHVEKDTPGSREQYRK